MKRTDNPPSKKKKYIWSTNTHENVQYPLSIREITIKTALRFQITAVRMTICVKMNIKCLRGHKERRIHILF